MKIFKTFTLLLLATALYAAEVAGVLATVELVNGTRQRAQFLGITNDTVSLGGSIQGKFTIVRIAKNRFKSIVDDQGNDLLAAAPVPADSVTQVDTLATADTAAVRDSSIVQDSSAVDSAVASDSSAIAASSSVSNLPNVDGKHILVSLERRSSDSVLAHLLSNLSIRMLQESGTPVMVLSRSDIADCTESRCIWDTLKTHGAASAYIGRITAARTPDSVTVQMTHYVLGDSAQDSTTIAQINLSSFQALNDAMSKNKFRNFIGALQGEAPAKVVTNKASYIHVETDPEGANIAYESGKEICRSPCTFATQDTGKVVLYAYWSVDKQLWGGRDAIVPIPADTARISLKLKKVRPELRVTSSPEGAEVFAGSSPVTKNTEPIGKTPGLYPVLEPGPSTVQIKKQGFRDTSITLFVPPTELTDIHVDLQPIATLSEQQAQEQWYRERKKNFIGKTLMGSSVAPILIGALFTYLASCDYDDAQAIKDELNRPAAANGEHYQKKVDENHDLVDRGDRKMIIGGSLIGAGILMFGVGFALTF